CTSVLFNTCTDGRFTVGGMANVNIHTIYTLLEKQGAVQGCNWQQELVLPTYDAEWDEMARPHSLPAGAGSVCIDGSMRARLQGNLRLLPQHVMLPRPCDVR